MDIGEEQETVVVEPVEDPVKRPARPNPEPVPVPVREPEKVPARIRAGFSKAVKTGADFRETRRAIHQVGLSKSWPLQAGFIQLTFGSPRRCHCRQRRPMT